MFKWFMIICVVMIILFLKFRGLLKRKDFRIWLFCHLVACIIAFTVSCFAVLMLFLDKFYPTWMAAIIAVVISLASMIVLKGLVDNEIKKFESLKSKETKKIPLERN